MDIVVTGGAGFLGSHLCGRLLGRGHRVICLDDFSSGQLSNVAAHLPHPQFELLRHDVVDAFPLTCEVDQIFHLACPASPKRYQVDPVRTAKTCVLGTLNVLEFAARRGARVLLASTSEVYGDPEVHPQHEGYLGNVNPIGPRGCYDEGKRLAETLCTDFRRTRGVDARVARIFNTFGPRMLPDDGRVVSNLIVQALLGEALTIYGDGSQTRSFCFVDDLLDGVLALMAAPDCPAPINLGNPHEVSVRELAGLVLELTRSRSFFSYEPLPEDDPVRRCPDIGRARSLLDWQPVIGLRQGLERTISYFAELLSEARAI